MNMICCGGRNAKSKKKGLCFYNVKVRFLQGKKITFIE